MTAGDPTLLVAVDAGDASGPALRWGAALAARHGARLVVCHAVEDRVGRVAAGLAGGETHAATDPDDLRASAEARLAALARSAGAPDAALRVVGGAPAEAVCELAAQLDADLLVVGSSRKRGLRRLLGSTSADLVQHAGRPVLVVHADDAGSPDAVRRVLAAVDFGPEALAAARAALCWFASERGPSLLLLHVHQPHAFVGPGFPPAAAPPVETEAGLRDHLERLAAELRDGQHPVEVDVELGPAGPVIAEEAEERRVDLVAMGSRGVSDLERVLLGSASRKVTPLAPCPVLVVPTRSEAA